MNNKLDEFLSYVFNAAIEYAGVLRHSVLTIEHVFHAILKHDIGVEILTSVKDDIDIDKLSSAIESYLQRYVPSTINLNYDHELQNTPALMRVYANMMDHLESAGQENAGIEDFLVAMMSEKISYSVKLLNMEGITITNLKKAVIKFQLEKQMSNQLHQESKRNAKKSILDEFATNLNEQAKKGKIDPLVGRAKELEKIIQILCRRKKNNPVLLGEAGVGKSAIIEGLALAIVNKKVPPKLKDSIIYSLDISSVVAGTKYRGEFETKMQNILKELTARKNVIIFLDEIHMMVGAGSTTGSTIDVSNILKPSLASGAIKVIGATTFAEYKATFEKDKALSRRFLQVKIDELSPEDSLKILEKIAPIYEKFHNVKYDHEALQASVELSSKYIFDRHLPDKAIDLIDEVGAKTQLKSKGKNEVTLITKYQIEDLVSANINIPKSTLSKSEDSLLLDLDTKLKHRIFSQDAAIDEVVAKIRVNKAGLGELDRPIATFLFAGPSGVGKTELSRELANILGIKFERIDMSEYMESISVSKLIGAAPGYVGYDSGGLLVTKIRTNPHCVLLLDEIEKAHPDVYNILLQVMDSATLTDNMGNKADFKNVILIMTSNAGSKESASMGFLDAKSREDKAIKDIFTPEFRGRLDAVVNFNSLGEKDYEKIVGKYIHDLSVSLKSKNITVKIDSKASAFIAQKSIDNALGAREIRRIIDSEIKPKLSMLILFGELKHGGEAKITCDKNGLKITPHTKKKETTKAKKENA
ncbi:ATP-dependent Clp protease ATP-binding subunit ClpA [Helicobacter sp. 13S00401-1]|uniref:AAA family ATPase n=1 Tax=Helicobacter sp. 13S00401-1 TaxID=1905758 RepID=UPI000BA4EDDC|nr:AAA family ATPase [Helicobacter sp. 13S00401-1]PAF51127.1 ATP-dependent Clp protease ATP-binding subunit ClpA [Helicobacter sp. 13S00401-1]